MLFRSVSQSRYRFHVLLQIFAIDNFDSFNKSLRIISALILLSFSSVVPVGLNKADAVIKTSVPLDSTKGFLFDNGSFDTNDNIQRPYTPPASFDRTSYASTPVSYASGAKLVGLHGDLSVSASGLKISALRSATALQKYKEIQNSNDPDRKSVV